MKKDLAEAENPANFFFCTIYDKKDLPVEKMALLQEDPQFKK